MGSYASFKKERPWRASKGRCGGHVATHLEYFNQLDIWSNESHDSVQKK